MIELSHINHVGIAVENLEEAKSLYRDILGLSLIHEQPIEDVGLETAWFQVGDGMIELLEATEDGPDLTDYVSGGGNGLHHVAFEVEDLDVTVERLQSDGITFRVLPKVGREGTRTSFVDPSHTNGVHVEILEEL